MFSYDMNSFIIYSGFVFDHAKWPRMQMDEDFLKLSKMFNAMRSVVRVPNLDPKYMISVLALIQSRLITALLICYTDGMAGDGRLNSSSYYISDKLRSYGKYIINSHHGLLPSFKGGSPSKQVQIVRCFQSFH
ncbi:formyltetrahydrofolate deformylase 1, mitochondrial-like [Henckelia pumila]|uniref:formyltetrahydrofolate deformylase 1, mitochondrial-like n=1 Tax=Henckelia pumila TaxID=405737 RepID=UPI003C6DB979